MKYMGRYIVLLFFSAFAGTAFSALEPVAQVDIKVNSLTMVVNSLGYHSLELQSGCTRRQDDGNYALYMPLPSRNFLPESLTGSNMDTTPPGIHLKLVGNKMWESPQVALQYRFGSLARPGRFGLLFSVYARGERDVDVPVRLSMQWLPKKIAADKTTNEKEYVATGEWHRLSVSLNLNEHQIDGAAVIRIISEGPVEIAGLQIEPWGDYPVFQRGPTEWLPGGTMRDVRPPTLPVWPIDMDWQQGTVTMKVLITGTEEPEITGDRQILFVGNFWQGMLEIMTSQVRVGKTTIRIPTLPRILSDGKEHFLSLSWSLREIKMFADGNLIAHGAMHPGTIELEPYSRLWLGTHNPRKRNLGGTISEVCFYNQPFNSENINIAPSEPDFLLSIPVRYVFRRDEENVVIRLPLKGQVPRNLSVAITGLPDATAEIIRNGESIAVQLVFQPWKYTTGKMDAEILLMSTGDSVKRWPWSVQIVPAEARDSYPVGNWGSPGNISDLEWARNIGLGLIDSRNYDPIYLNQVALYGLQASVNFRNIRCYPHPAIPEHLELARLEADRLTGSVCSFPWVRSCIHNSEGSGTDKIGESPAAISSLRKNLGLDAPLFPPVNSQWNLANRPKVDLKAFADTGIVPDDYMPLRYLYWLMHEGDGMNIHSRILADRLQADAPWIEMVQEPATPRPTALRYIDWADTLSNWRYANTPAPVLTVWRQGLAAAIASGKKYYPLVGHCYYSPGIFLIDGDKKTPVPPSGDMASAFLWTALALPADEIRVFGWWQKNWESNELLRPGSNERIKSVIAEVSRLGPVVGSVPLETAPLAVFFSTTNLLGRAQEEWWHAYGGLVYEIVTFFGNHDLPVDFIYEPQLSAGVLQRYKYLYIPALRYQRASVNNVIQEWRRNGGQLILDNLASPVFKADLTAPLISDKKEGLAYRIDENQCTIWVEDFRRLIQPYVRLEDGKAIIITKEIPGTHFVFAINNSWKEETALGRQLSGVKTGSDIIDEIKEFKEQGLTGQLNTRLEDVGVTQTITLSLSEKPDAVVYDLRAGLRLQPHHVRDGRLFLRLTIEAGSAALLAVYPCRADHLKIICPSGVHPGQIAELKIHLLNSEGQLLPGRQGVRIEVRDPAGNLTDASAIYRLEDGETDIRVRLPLSAPTGQWKVIGHHIASSLRTDAIMTVNP